MSKFAVKMAVAKAVKNAGKSYKVGPYKVRKYPYGLAVVIDGFHFTYSDSDVAIRDMVSRGGKLSYAFKRG